MASAVAAVALVAVRPEPDRAVLVSLVKLQRLATIILCGGSSSRMGTDKARLDWDGKTLKEDKASWWPQAVSGARILSDLQLTLWPVRAIQAALPPGWALADSGDTRTLTQDGEVVTIVRRLSPGVVEIDQQREHFKLRIESRDLGSDAQFSD